MEFLVSQINDFYKFIIVKFAYVAYKANPSFLLNEEENSNPIENFNNFENIKIINGIDILFQQAIHQFNLFTGLSSPPIEILKPMILDQI